jgi:hypothetical protein
MAGEVDAVVVSLVAVIGVYRAIIFSRESFEFNKRGR